MEEDAISDQMQEKLQAEECMIVTNLKFGQVEAAAETLRENMCS